MNKIEFENKLKNIPEITPDEFDTEMIQNINTRNAIDSSTVPIEEIEYSGKISLRVPKTLHKDLVQNAKQERISLNQYILYKLAKRKAGTPGS